MTQGSFYGAAFLVLFLMIALAYRWLRQRTLGGPVAAGAASKVISAVAVGPQQRVVTVEVGPQGQRTWLILGVTSQAVNCLHRIAVDSSGMRAPGADGVDAVLDGPANEA